MEASDGRVIVQLFDVSLHLIHCVESYYLLVRIYMGVCPQQCHVLLLYQNM